MIFVLFPLVIWTGLAMSPAIEGVFPALVTVLGGRQSARTIHFFVSIFLVLFLLVHVVMVYLAGFRNRVGAMIIGRLPKDCGATMNKISRRRLITAGLVGTAGATGFAVAVNLAKRYGFIPPDAGVLYGPGETLTYAAQRLLSRHSMAREFARSEISKDPFANEVDPLGIEFQRLRDGAFVDWRLAVDGMVARPMSFSLAELKSLPQSCPDHVHRVRRGLVLYRRMERRSARSRTKSGGRSSPGPIYCLPFDPAGLVGQHRYV